MCKTDIVYLSCRGKPNLLDLGSLMIRPVQRVMKYPLLLRELRAATPASHPDAAALRDALAAVRDVNVNINELKRRKDLGRKRRGGLRAAYIGVFCLRFRESQRRRSYSAVSSRGHLGPREGIVLLPRRLGWGDEDEAER